MFFRQVFDSTLAQYAYLVGCQLTNEALVIDPQRDIDRYVEIAEREGLRITSVAETHIHADFVSGAREFAERYGTRTYLSGEGGPDWNYAWPALKRRDGSAYDVILLKDGSSFSIGNVDITAVHTPGHTPEHLSFVVTDTGAGAMTPLGVATGDFVFVGDLGRPDLLEQAAGIHGMQEPSARQLFRSLPRFTELQDHLQVWPGHGAGSACGKALGAVPTTTVGYERLHNASLDAARHGEDAFVEAILFGQPEPPMYFGRMKQLNKFGPDILGDLPRPAKLSAEDLARVVAERSSLIVDTRLDRSAFMARHIAGSQYAPLNKNFSTVVGSLVEEPEEPLTLIVDERYLDEAVRNLVRIGYDNVVGYAAEGVLEAYLSDGGDSAAIDEITFVDAMKLMGEGSYSIVDTRYISEFDAGHVQGAVSASYTRLPEYAAERLGKRETVLVHCRTGRRAAPASAWLARNGYDVKYVNDDVLAFLASGRKAS